MLHKKNELYYLEQGSLVFTLNLRLKKLEMSWRAMLRQFFVNPLILGLNLVFMVVDALNFWNLYHAVANDNIWLEAGLVVFSVILLDFTGLILGHALKKKKQGYKVEVLPLMMGCLAFVIAMFINFTYRFVFAKKLFPPTLYTTYVNNHPQFHALDASGWIALNYSLIPLAVLFFTFMLTYLFANPLLEELRLERDKLELIKSERSQFEAVLNFYANARYKQNLQVYDDTQYAYVREFVRIQAEIFRNEIREEMKLKMKSPEKIGWLSRKVIALKNKIFGESKTENKESVNL